MFFEMLFFLVVVWQIFGFIIDVFDALSSSFENISQF